MYVRIEEQLLLFFASFVCGALLSVFYDIIRMSRMALGVRYGGIKLPDRRGLSLPLLPKKEKTAPRPRTKRMLNAAVFFGDLLFFVVAAFAMLCVFFNYGGGRVRGAGIFLAVCGFLACHFTVGAIVIRLFAVIKLALGITVEYLLFFLLFPVKRLLWPVLRAVLRVVRRGIGTVYLRMYTKNYEKKAVNTLCGLKAK